ncbi:hypothetical protein ACJX0J_006085 [Zea mays]
MLSKHIVIETVIFRPRYQIKNIAWIYYFNMFTAQWAIEVAQTASTLMFTFRGNPHSIAHNLMSHLIETTRPNFIDPTLPLFTIVYRFVARIDSDNITTR